MKHDLPFLIIAACLPEYTSDLVQCGILSRLSILQNQGCKQSGQALDQLVHHIHSNSNDYLVQVSLLINAGLADNLSKIEGISDGGVLPVWSPRVERQSIVAHEDIEQTLPNEDNSEDEMYFDERNEVTQRILSEVEDHLMR